MKNFVEICFALFYLNVIHSVSGKSRKLLILCHTLPPSLCRAMRKEKLFYVILIWFFFPLFWEALRCYSCSITSQSSDMKCLNDPSNLDGPSIVNCNRKYCTIFRQELKVFSIKNFVSNLANRKIFCSEKSWHRIKYWVSSWTFFQWYHNLPSNPLQSFALKCSFACILANINIMFFIILYCKRRKFCSFLKLN